MTSEADAAPGPRPQERGGSADDPCVDQTSPHQLPQRAPVAPFVPHQAEVLGESGPDEDELVQQIDELVRRPGSLRSVYQPIVDLRRGECIGYEALTRVAEWPAHSPQPWFTAATRGGLAARFEEAALRGALRGRSMIPAGRFLTVNLSAAGLQHEAVVALLLEQPDLHGLVIEITDVPAVLAAPQSLGMLGELRSRGLMAAADLEDGGAHELARIGELRPDLVKLERSLVHGLHGDPVRRRVVASLASFVTDLGATCLGEGVERREDAHALQDLGVRFGQGWLFGRARPGFMPGNEESAGWLATSWTELLERSRLARLVRRVPTRAQIPGTGGADGEPLPGQTTGGHPGQWWATVTQDGRLLQVHTPNGDRIAGSELVRLRASSDVGTAARRYLSAEGRRSRTAVAAAVDDQGGFLGLVDTVGLLREALVQDQRPGSDDATGS